MRQILTTLPHVRGRDWEVIDYFCKHLVARHPASIACWLLARIEHLAIDLTRHQFNCVGLLEQDPAPHHQLQPVAGGPTG